MLVWALKCKKVTSAAELLTRALPKLPRTEATLSFWATPLLEEAARRTIISGTRWRHSPDENSPAICETPLVVCGFCPWLSGTQ
jgi:hypothetical protein